MPAVLTKTGLRVREREPPPARPLPALEPVAPAPWYSRPQSARPFAGVFGGTASSRLNSSNSSNTTAAAYGRPSESSRGRPRSAEARQQRSRSSSSKENHHVNNDDANSSSRASLGRSKSASRRKPEWDSGVQDPAQYRLSKEERAAKSRCVAKTDYFNIIVFVSDYCL
jgi:hypothetical protein